MAISLFSSYDSAADLFNEVDQIARDAQERAKKALDDATDLLRKAKGKLPSYDTDGLKEEAGNIIERVSRVLDDAIDL